MFKIYGSVLLFFAEIQPGIKAAKADRIIDRYFFILVRIFVIGCF